MNPFHSDHTHDAPDSDVHLLLFGEHGDNDADNHSCEEMVCGEECFDASSMLFTFPASAPPPPPPHHQRHHQQQQQQQEENDNDHGGDATSPPPPFYTFKGSGEHEKTAALLGGAMEEEEEDADGLGLLGAPSAFAFDVMGHGGGGNDDLLDVLESHPTGQTDIFHESHSGDKAWNWETVPDSSSDESSNSSLSPLNFSVSSQQQAKGDKAMGFSAEQLQQLQQLLSLQQSTETMVKEEEASAMTTASDEAHCGVKRKASDATSARQKKRSKTTAKSKSKRKSKQQEQEEQADNSDDTQDSTGSSSSSQKSTTSTSSSHSKKGRSTRSEEERDRAKLERQRELNALVEKRNNGKLTAVEQKRLKTIRNQLTAQESRDRKQRTIETLTEENEQLRQENATLKERVTVLEKELETYHGRETTTTTTSTSSRGATLAVFMVIFCVGIVCFQQFSTHDRYGNDNVHLFHNDDSLSLPTNHQPNRSHQRSIKAASISSILPPESYPRLPSVNIINQMPDRPSYHNNYGVIDDDDRIVVEITNGSGGDGEYSSSLHQEEHVNLEDMDRTFVRIPQQLKKHFKSVNKPFSLAKSSRPRPNFARTAEHARGPSKYSSVPIIQSTFPVQSTALVDKDDMESSYLYHFLDTETTEDVQQDAEGEDTSKPVLHFFCPFAYSMLPSSTDGPTNLEQACHGNRNFDIKLYIPDEMSKTAISSTTGERVIRVAEMTARDVGFSEAFFAIDKPQQQQYKEYPRSSQGVPFKTASDA